MKPSNILINCSDPDFDWYCVNTSKLSVKLTDFGTSRCLEDINRHRDDITVIGTLAYISPEFREAMIKNYQTTEAGVEVDIYAAGLIAFKMNQGFLPGD